MIGVDPTPGAYDSLITDALAGALTQSPLVALSAGLDDAESADYYACHVADAVRRTVQARPAAGRAASAAALVNDVLKHLDAAAGQCRRWVTFDLKLQPLVELGRRDTGVPGFIGPHHGRHKLGQPCPGFGRQGNNRDTGQLWQQPGNVVIKGEA